MPRFGWVTNDPVAAKALRKADAAYKRAVSNTGALTLAEKVSVLRAASLARDAAYDAAVSGAADVFR